MKYKICPACRINKPLDGGFYKHIGKARGFSSHCKTCANRQKRITRAKRKKYGAKARRRQSRIAMLAKEYVRYAIAKGELFRPAACELCGQYKPRIQAHHPNYWKPLAVLWVCQSCHIRIDGRSKKPSPSGGLLRSVK